MQLFEYIDIMNKPYDIFYSNSVSSALHWHYYSEILYITKGSIKVICNNKTVNLEKGDFCYIFPLQLHEVIKAENEIPEYAVIKFDIHTINIPQAYLSRFYDLFIRRTEEEDSCLVLRHFSCEALVDNIESEYLQKKEFYSLKIQSDLYALLIEVARKLNKKTNAQKTKCSDTNFSFYHILEYIDIHSGDNLDIKELAVMCHMSYSNFAKLFKENYGRSCKEYITYIRLNKAQDLLFHTDFDLTYIASETGFFDCSHFIRTYKKWKNITPKQERLIITSGEQHSRP